MARAKPSRADGTTSRRAQATKIPDSVYRSLALDVTSSDSHLQGERPLKRRRVAGDAPEHEEVGPRAERAPHPPTDAAGSIDLAEFEPQEDQTILSRLNGSLTSAAFSDDEALSSHGAQVVYDDSESSEDGDDEEDGGWEKLFSEPDQVPENAAENKDKAGDRIQLDLSTKTDTPLGRATIQRLSSTVVEKRKRLDIHKIHLCALTAHCYIRNAWCNDHRVRNILSKVLDKRTKAFLIPKRSLSQRDRTTQFIKGLEEASHTWRGKFVISVRGMRKPEWPVDEKQLEFIAKQAEGTDCDRRDFLRASARPSGSRDVGAQLFCALLRSVGVDARLVCSLQPLSFISVAPVLTPTPQKAIIDLSASAADYDTDASAASAGSASSAPRAIKRFGGQTRGTSPRRDLGKAPATPRNVKGRDSPYPIFWVEAFNTAKQQWVSVDPFATRTVNRPPKLEPPASDPLNDMTYVVAFNDDGTAKDVTRRYTKAFNAKTRRNRVEVTEGGERWYRQVVKVFRSPTGRTDREIIEDGELDGYEAKEPMPRNAQDFKSHPYYALERHLKRHEVVHPRREVGKLRTGKGENIEPVFRRRDIKLCQTANNWYRNGRELKPGEQPLKRVRARRKPRREPDDADDIEEEGDGTVGLFAHHQTELYKPPSCAHGRVPKNPYKNLDIYVPSMIPPGGVHIRSSDGVAAARILRIDYAEAVAGFQFKGRKGTAVVKGVIVANEYKEAMEEVTETLRWQRSEADRTKRSRLALGMWKRFLVGMRIRERIMSGQEGASASGEGVAPIEDENSGSEYAPEDNEGGFVAADGPIARPSRGIDRDVVKEKFQDDFAETVNDDFAKNSKEYWEPPVASPWDVPGLLEPVEPEYLFRGTADGRGDIDALFDEPTDEGGFVRKVNGQTPGPKEDRDLASAAGDAVEDTETGGGFMMEGPPEQEHPQDEICSNVKSLTALEVGTNGTADDQHGDPVTAAPKPEASNNADMSDELDNQSLLSHDPDDDDAEPEWLDDEVGL